MEGYALHILRQCNLLDALSIAWTPPWAQAMFLIQNIPLLWYAIWYVIVSPRLYVILQQAIAYC